MTREWLGRGIERLRIRFHPRPPSLRLWLPSHVSLMRCDPPRGYALRGFRAGDEEAWCDLLGAGGELGDWTLPRLRHVIEGGLIERTQRFVVHDGRVVACAGVYDRCCCGFPAWEIGWVATHPEHRRLGLGRCVMTDALLAGRRLSPRPVFLLTDDFRLEALRLYLKLGFVPDCTSAGFAERWAAVSEQLGGPYAELADMVRVGRPGGRGSSTAV